MSLIYKPIGISQVNGTIIIIDTTGTYDAVSNIGGWGSPNPLRSSIASFSLLSLKNLNTNVQYYPVPPSGASLDVLSSPYLFPKTNLSFILTTPIISGNTLTGNFPDGVYHLSSSLEAASSPYGGVANYFSVTNVIDCVICKLAYKVGIGTLCKTSKETYMRLMTLRTALTACLDITSPCGVNPTAALDCIAQMQVIIANASCNCGC